MEKITSHKDLALKIRDKNILHLNSLGKDAVLVLEWLVNYAKPKKIVSLYFKIKSGFPDDNKYLKYLKKRYPNVIFVEEESIQEMNEIMATRYQSPLVINHVILHQDYLEFDGKKVIENCIEKYGCDLAASGMSAYEGMGRAILMRKRGLYQEDRKMIFPLGLMKYSQIKELLKKSGIKLNPSYKFENSSFDTSSYYKMRAGFIARPDFKKVVTKYFPLIVLDIYRYEVLFEKYARKTEEKKNPKAKKNKAT